MAKEEINKNPFDNSPVEGKTERTTLDKGNKQQGLQSLNRMIKRKVPQKKLENKMEEVPKKKKLLPLI
jgi:hypothetical protein